MKKINALFYVIGIVCFLIAGYIIYDEFFVDDEILVNFNEEEELVLLNNRLAEIGSPLGKIVIVDALISQDRNGKYNITYNKDLFDNYSYRQLFVMEYILSYTNNYDLFTVYDSDGYVIDETPTSEFTFSYIDYTDFNKYYLSIFGDNFDLNKADKGSLLLPDSNNYVYYDNRRSGANGVYVSMVQASGVEYSDGIYSANAVVTYSTKASELFDVREDTAVIKYTKDINGNIILKSFTLNG